MQSIPQCCRAMLYETKLDNSFCTMPKYACANICTVLTYMPCHQYNANRILGTFFHGHPHVLRCINTSLSKEIKSNSKIHSIQKRSCAPNTTDLRAELDVLAKTHFPSISAQTRVTEFG